MTFTWSKEDDLVVKYARALAADAVQKVGNGHPGTAMALAPAAYLLFQKYLKHSPKDPNWLGRDRFVLSAGHSRCLDGARGKKEGFALGVAGSSRPHGMDPDRGPLGLLPSQKRQLRRQQLRCPLVAMADAITSGFRPAGRGQADEFPDRPVDCAVFAGRLRDVRHRWQRQPLAAPMAVRWDEVVRLAWLRVNRWKGGNGPWPVMSPVRHTPACHGRFSGSWATSASPRFLRRFWPWDGS